MADNFTYTPGTGETGAADDIDGVKYPRVKVVIGANNTNDGDISSANPMPVTGTITAVTAISNALPVGNNNIGDVDVASIAAGTNLIGKVSIDQATANANEVVTKTGSVTNATLSAETTKVIGTVNVAAAQTIAVTNAGTFATQATLQAGSAAIGKLAANSGVDIGDVDVTSCALPTGASTAANQTTIIGHVDGIESSLTSIDGKITACNTGAVVLAAGTAAIGKLAANSGVDIGDVDVASIAAGTNAIGKLLPPDVDVTAHTNYARKYYTSAGAATDGIIWSPASGKRWHVTSLIFQVSADATVTFEDDKAAGDDPVLKGEFKAGSGLALTFDEKYPFASGEDAADLLVTTSAGNIYVSVVGYEI